MKYLKNKRSQNSQENQKKDEAQKYKKNSKNKCMITKTCLGLRQHHRHNRYRLLFHKQLV